VENGNLVGLEIPVHVRFRDQTAKLVESGDVLLSNMRATLHESNDNEVDTISLMPNTSEEGVFEGVLLQDNTQTLACDEVTLSVSFEGLYNEHLYSMPRKSISVALSRIKVEGVAVDIDLAEANNRLIYRNLWEAGPFGKGVSPISLEFKLTDLDGVHLNPEAITLNSPEKLYTIELFGPTAELEETITPVFKKQADISVLEATGGLTMTEQGAYRFEITARPEAFKVGYMPAFTEPVIVEFERYAPIWASPIAFWMVALSIGALGIMLSYYATQSAPLQLFPDNIKSRLLYHKYQRSICQFMQQIGVTKYSLVEAPEIKKGTLWEISLPDIGLSLRTQRAMLFLRRTQEDDATHTFLDNELAKNPTIFLIIVDCNSIEHLTMPSYSAGTHIIHVNSESVKELLQLSETKILPWLSRLITSQIDPLVLEGMLPYATEGNTAMFYGRDEELMRLLGGKIRGGIITGHHQSGKTSLLVKLAEVLREDADRHVIGALTLGGKTSFEYLFARTFSELEIAAPSEMTPEAWGTALRKYGQAGHNPIFLLDEVDDLLYQDEEDNFRLGKLMRSLQSDGFCTFYLAGHAQLRRAIQSDEGPFRRFAEEIRLKGLTESPSIALIREPMRKLGFNITIEQSRSIYTGTAGVPVLMQEFCKRLLKILYQKQKTDLRRQEVSNDIIKEIANSPDYLTMVFHYYNYNQSWESQAVILMTALLGSVKHQDIDREFAKHVATLTPKRLDAIVNTLVDFGVLEETTFGLYQLAARYLSTAIRARDPQATLHMIFSDRENFQ
jgi:hypothetical protein